jgi:threonine aldolase
MEAALFVPTGTFGNQLAIFTHCKRGDEVILGEDCHIVAHEVGGAAVISGVQLRTVEFDGGMPCAEKIKKRIRTAHEIHEPVTTLICLENALAKGRVVPIRTMQSIHELAKENEIPIHLDGARLFNAAEALGVQADKIAALCDSVMLCLSKGLCAPVGSILAGKRDFIGEARRKRKLLGGGMRQAGVLAAPGLIALEVMTKRLNEDHANAKLLGKLLADIEHIDVIGDIDISMVFFKTNTNINLHTELAKRGIMINDHDKGVYRMVTHNEITEEDVRRVAEVIRGIGV